MGNRIPRIKTNIPRQTSGFPTETSIGHNDMASPNVKNFMERGQEKLKPNGAFNMNSETNLDIGLPPTSATTTSSQTQMKL